MYSQHDIERHTHHLAEEIRSYADGRRKDVARGAETPELAALLVDKYAAGIVRALWLLEFPSRENLTAIADALVREIDPDFDENTKKRWAARPAQLVFGEVIELDPTNIAPFPPMRAVDTEE